MAASSSADGKVAQIPGFDSLSPRMAHYIKQAFTGCEAFQTQLQTLTTNPNLIWEFFGDYWGQVDISPNVQKEAPERLSSFRAEMINRQETILGWLGSPSSQFHQGALTYFTTFCKDEVLLEGLFEVADTFHFRHAPPHVDCPSHIEVRERTVTFIFNTHSRALHIERIPATLDLTLPVLKWIANLLESPAQDAPRRFANHREMGPTDYAWEGTASTAPTEGLPPGDRARACPSYKKVSIELRQLMVKAFTLEPEVTKKLRAITRHPSLRWEVDCTNLGTKLSPGVLEHFRSKGRSESYAAEEQSHKENQEYFMVVVSAGLDHSGFFPEFFRQCEGWFSDPSNLESMKNLDGFGWRHAKQEEEAPSSWQLEGNFLWWTANSHTPIAHHGTGSTSWHIPTLSPGGAIHNLLSAAAPYILNGGTSEALPLVQYNSLIVGELPSPASVASSSSRDPKPCTNCGGTGQAKCGVCNGSGKKFGRACAPCSGSGFQPKTPSIKCGPCRGSGQR